MSKGHQRRKAQKRATKQLHSTIGDLNRICDVAQNAYYNAKERLLFQYDLVESLRLENAALRARIAELEAIVNTQPALAEPSIMTDCEGESYTLNLPTTPTPSALRNAMVVNLED